jgi:hypothetical protein
MARPKVNVVLSYTRREKEIAELQPLTDEYCRLLFDWGRESGVDIFYDRVSLPQYRRYSDEELECILTDGINNSHLFVGFFSPHYVSSRWCRFEYTTMKQLREQCMHIVYWKPEICMYPNGILSMIGSRRRTNFLRNIANWQRRGPEYGCRHFTDLTHEYKYRAQKGATRELVWCVRESADILVREHRHLFSSWFNDDDWFETLWYRYPWKYPEYVAP